MHQGIPPKKKPRKNLTKATKNSYGKSIRNSFNRTLKLVTKDGINLDLQKMLEFLLAFLKAPFHENYCSNISAPLIHI